MDKELLIAVVKSAIDIFLVTAIIYYSLNFLVRTKKYAMIIYTILLFVVLYSLSSILELKTLNFILSSIYSWGLIIIVVVFQNEIKDSLERIGQFTSFSSIGKPSELYFIDELCEAVYELASKKTGAIITIKRSNSLEKFTKNAIKIDGVFSKYLLYTIFNKEAPIHDGAVIIDSEKIAYASTYFPIALDLNLSKEFGTRHRAALTISRETDSITIVVSEETGKVSITYAGKLYRDLEAEFFKELLAEKLDRRKGWNL